MSLWYAHRGSHPSCHIERETFWKAGTPEAGYLDGERVNTKGRCIETDTAAFDFLWGE